MSTSVPRKKRYNVRFPAAAGCAATLGALAVLVTGPAQADTRSDRIRLLETTVQELLKRDEQREARMRRLEKELQRLRGRRLTTVKKAPPAGRAPAGGGHTHGTGKTAPKGHGHDHGSGHTHAKGGDGHDAKHGHDDHVDEVWSARIGDGILRLRRIGIDADMAFGFGTGNQETISTLFGGGHDPHQNGFTLRSVDFSISGSFDPYFDARFNAVFFIDAEGETRIELEEAFLQSKTIAGFLKLRGGLFFTPFGAYNQLHIHDQDWMTQPVIMTRLLGEDGLRGIGALAIIDLPVPWRSARLYLGMQNARGETQYSFLASDEVFEERPIGGLGFAEREVNGLGTLAYYVRLTSDFALAKSVDLALGGSAVFGPNATGSGGRTILFGFDATFTWRTASLGTVVWRTEFAQRIYGVDKSQRDVVNGRKSLTDLGLYTQVLWKFHPKWGVGLRYEYATGHGLSGGEYESRGADPFRGDRHRLSPIVYWQFARFARATIQYTYDHADFLSDDKNAHAIWFGVRWSFGLGAGHSHIPDGRNDHHGHDH